VCEKKKAVGVSRKEKVTKNQQHSSKQRKTKEKQQQIARGKERLLHGRSEGSKQRKEQSSREMDEDWWKVNHENADGLTGGLYDRDGIAGQSVRDA